MTKLILSDLFRPRHNQLAALNQDLKFEYQTEHDHPQSLVVKDENHNVEVIYHTSGDVVLIQTNGNKPRTEENAFVWANDPRVLEKVTNHVRRLLS